MVALLKWCHFCCRYLVSAAQATVVEIIDRCNLTVLQEPGQEDLADFLAEHKVSAGAHASAAL